MISQDDNTNLSATIVACPRCHRRFYCNPQGHCWCMAMAAVPDISEEPEDGDCLCPDCLAERDS